MSDHTSEVGNGLNALQELKKYTLYIHFSYLHTLKVLLTSSQHLMYRYVMMMMGRGYITPYMGVSCYQRYLQTCLFNSLDAMVQCNHIIKAKSVGFPNLMGPLQCNCGVPSSWHCSLRPSEGPPNHFIMSNMPCQRWEQ